ncbi:hypothetical protein B0H14DRAFT_2558827 [Mycena olivaceomarginata]|nr:hypothetical protein B0H14DRAFT_2558827 [Mycena olivaceomarginata]
MVNGFQPVRFNAGHLCYYKACGRVCRQKDSRSQPRTRSGGIVGAIDSLMWMGHALLWDRKLRASQERPGSRQTKDWLRWRVGYLQKVAVRGMVEVREKETCHVDVSQRNASQTVTSKYLTCPVEVPFDLPHRNATLLAVYETHMTSLDHRWPWRMDADAKLLAKIAVYCQNLENPPRSPSPVHAPTAPPAKVKVGAVADDTLGRGRRLRKSPQEARDERSQKAAEAILKTTGNKSKFTCNKSLTRAICVTTVRPISGWWLFVKDEGQMEKKAESVYGQIRGMERRRCELRWDAGIEQQEEAAPTTDNRRENSKHIRTSSLVRDLRFRCDPLNHLQSPSSPPRMPSITPSLPLELEREIFVLAARLHPGSIPTLLRVARRVLAWVRALMRATKSKPASFFHDAIRHLVVGPCPTWTQINTMAVLKLCTGVTDFAALGELADPSMLPALARMRLQRMAGNLTRLFGGRVDVQHPIFASIAHLDVFDRIAEGETYISTQIPALPALTHLSFHNDVVPWTKMQRVLQECPRLDVLVNLWHSTKRRYAYEKTANIPIHDVRIVLYLYNDYWGEWEADAMGLWPSFWSVADEFVARKRKGLIKGTLFQT